MLQSYPGSASPKTAGSSSTRRFPRPGAPAARDQITGVSALKFRLPAAGSLEGFGAETLLPWPLPAAGRSGFSTEIRPVARPAKFKNHFSG